MSRDRSCLAWLKILILLNCCMDSEHASCISGKGNWGLGGIIGGNFTFWRQPCSYIVPCLACVFYNIGADGRRTGIEQRQGQTNDFLGLWKLKCARLMGVGIITCDYLTISATARWSSESDTWHFCQFEVRCKEEWLCDEEYITDKCMQPHTPEHTTTFKQQCSATPFHSRGVQISKQ